MKTYLQIVTQRKRLMAKAIFLLFAAIVINGNVFGQTTITSTTSGGNWSNGSSWVGGVAPTSSNHVVIVSSATITLTSNAQCINLTLQGTTGTRLVIGDYTLSVSGILSGPNNTFTNNIITTNGTGRLKFIGASRALFAANWSPGSNTLAWPLRCEVALNATATGTSSTNIRFSELIVTSGTFQVGTTSSTRDLRIDGGSDGVGPVTIASGANLIVTGTMGTRNSTVTTYCGTISVNGTLTMMGSRLNGTISVNSGGVLLMKRISSTALSSNGSSTENFTYSTGSKLQYDVQNYFVNAGAEISQTQKVVIDANSYSIIDNLTVNNLTIALSGYLQINNTLELIGNLVTSGSATIAYGSEGTLYYKGADSQTTGDITFPSTNGPNNLTIENALGVFLHEDRTINGTILIKSGSLVDLQGYSITGTASYIIESNVTITTSHPNGLDGAIGTTGSSSSCDPSVNFIFDAPGNQNTGSMPSIINDLTADGGTILTVNSNNLTCNNITIGNGSSLLLTENYSLTCNGTIQVNTGSTLDANNVQIGGAGSIIIADWATFATANVNGLDGSLANIAYDFSPNANYTFNGTGDQTTGDKLPNYINALTVSNTSMLSLSNSLACNDVTTIGSAQLIVPPGMGLTSYGAANFESPLLLQTNTVDYRSQMGTFIHDGNNDGSGTVSGQISTQFRYTANGLTGKAGRSYYISPSVYNATSLPFNPAGGNSFSHYNLSTRMWEKISNNTTGLTSMHAYGFRASTTQTITLTGNPNADDSYTQSGLACPTTDLNWYYMIGNPYPATVNWQVIWANETSNLEPTMYYRTSTTDGLMTTYTYNAYSGGLNCDGYIAPMQAFWVKASTVAGAETASISISKSDRNHDWGTEAPYLKSPALRKTDTDPEKESFKLFINSSKNSDGILLVQSNLAKNELDKWDSHKMFSRDTSFAELYTLSPESYRLVIQSVNPILNEKLFPLGLLNTKPSRQYTFSADLSKSYGKYNYLLEDKKLNITQDLFLNNTYSFVSDALIDSTGERFVLHVVQAPTVMVSTSLSACAPQLIDLTASDITKGSTEGLIYTYWKDAQATIPYFTPQNAETGIYYIKGTASNGAYGISEPINVTINETPIIITTNPAPILPSTTIDLTAPEITLGSTSGVIYSYWLDANATIQYLTPTVATPGNYYIKGINNSSGCFAIGGPVLVSLITGIPTNVKNDLSIYSNGNQLYINNCELNSTITIYDLLGNVKFSGFVNSKSEKINTNLNTGIYIVKVANNNFSKTQKVFIR